MSAIDANALLAELADLGFYSECHVRESVTTTFDWLKELYSAGGPHGTIVIAEKQTAARGRRGRSWESPKGGAWMGILLRDNLPENIISCTSIVTAVGVARALNEYYNLPAKIKWPNDILLYNKKLCGILCELTTQGSQIGALSLGIGINVNNSVPNAARMDAISVSNVTGYDVDLQKFYGIVLRSFAKTYTEFQNKGFGPIKSAWKELSALGNRVWVHQNEERVAADVVGMSDGGSLIVKIDGVTRELIAEDVSLSLPEN